MAKKPPAKITEPEAPAEEAPKVELIGAPGGKSIDERMADLLREHQEMGARPK